MKDLSGFSPCPAGVWARLAAFGIDLGLVALVAAIVSWFAGSWGFYIPWEGFTLVLLMIYSAVLVGRKGATVGKRICGISLHLRFGGPVGWWRAFLRESIGKVVSGVFMGLGFIRAAWNREKRGWHDLLARTYVYRDRSKARYARWLLALELVLAGAWILRPAVTALEAWRFASSKATADRIPQRDPARLIEVTTLATNRMDAYQEWIAAHGQEPAQYVLEAASSHDLTLMGECHDVRESLEFLNRLIPDLYARAGVRCLALEVCLADDNTLLQRLVTGSEYDEELAMKIARRAPWATWGWKEYWEVLKTVWEVNRRLPQGQPPLRVVGLSRRWDGPSLALVRSGPFWERLRLWRIIPELPLIMLLPDHVYARNAAKETLDRGQKGLVWLGAAHTLIHSTGVPRMGALLFRKYGDKVFPIRLHENRAGRTAIGGFIEKVMGERQHEPVGFTVQGSPFAGLRDSLSGDWNSMFPYRKRAACFEDVVCGYVYLAPASQQTHCQWLEGYISARMFAQNKPFYERASGQKLANAQEANRAGRESGFEF